MSVSDDDRSRRGDRQRRDVRQSGDIPSKTSSQDEEFEWPVKGSSGRGSSGSPLSGRSPLPAQVRGPLPGRRERRSRSGSAGDDEFDDSIGTEELSVAGLPPRKPLWKKLLLAFGIAAAVSIVAGVVAMMLTINHFSQDLPDVRTLQNNYVPPQVTRVVARDGTLLANIFSQRRTVVPQERIPGYVKNAFLAAEDAGFFEHEGLDFLGLLRAVVVNVRAGQVKQGGSTITQQVVKNVLLDNERSYKRKIRETILAYRLEKTLTKEQILGMYMNHIYLGHGRYGVEEAGRYLFGKHVQELTVAEAALLAGIVASPEHYSPRKSESKAIARRKYVLGQMLEKGFMTQAVYDDALEAPIRLAPVAESESDIAPEMVGHAQRLLRQMVGERAQMGGFTVHTTIDPALQVAARAALRAGLDDYLKRQKLKPPYTLEKRRLWGEAFEGTPRRYGIYVGTVTDRDDEEGTISVQVGDTHGVIDLNEEERFNPTHLSPTDFVGPNAAIRVQLIDDPDTASTDQPARLRLELGPQGAVVVLDPTTREVLASVGSYEALPGGLDRSTQTKRQPGSTFKPIVYSYALSTHQVTPATHFEFPSKEVPASPDGEPATPKNEELSLRQGVAKSDNRVAARVLSTVGAQQAVQWAQAMGIESKLGATDSLMLGAYEVTVAEMASAFSVFASGGLAQSPSFIQRVENGAGELPMPARSPAHRVMDPAVAYLTTSLLESVIQEGTGRRAAALGRPLAGKTGTTNRAKDAWFVGYSTEYVVAVWVGFDDAMPLGWGESGATSALPIWTEFMKVAHKGKPATGFPRPSEVREVSIDPATGKLARYGQLDAVTELFLPGTEPEEEAPEPAPELDPEANSGEPTGGTDEPDDPEPIKDPEQEDDPEPPPPPGPAPPPF